MIWEEDKRIRTDRACRRSLGDSGDRRLGDRDGFLPLQVRRSNCDVRESEREEERSEELVLGEHFC